MFEVYVPPSQLHNPWDIINYGTLQDKNIYWPHAKINFISKKHKNIPKWLICICSIHCYVSKHQDWLAASVSGFFFPRSRRKRRTLRRSKISQSPRCLEMEIGDGWFRGWFFFMLFSEETFFTYTFSHYEMIVTLTWYWHAGNLTYIQLSSLYNHGKWHVFKVTSREVIFYTRKWWCLGDPTLLYSKGVTCSQFIIWGYLC